MGIISDLRSLQAEMNRQAITTEDGCLRQVAEQILGRPFEQKDAKDFVIFQEENVFDKYELAYKGVRVGRIEKKFEGLKYMVDFIPYNTKSTNERNPS